MRWLKLPGIVEWMDKAILAGIDQKRKSDREIVRERKLGTIESVWLMLAVALDTGRQSLDEILRLATADLGIAWDVSVSAFCRARKRFSPPAFAVSSRTACCEDIPQAREQSGQVEGIHAQSR